MLEYVPFILGFFIGTVAQRARGRAHSILTTLAELSAGLAGTAVSGEYLEGWGRLPLDVAEAALGVGVAFVFATAINRARRHRIR
jgi:hypothetical protein